MVRNLIYFSMVSLDGFIARPDGSLDWSVINEELHKFVNRQQAAMGAYLHGRRIYEMMADYWPTADQDPAAPDYIVEFAGIWKNKPKLVFSTTLERVEWNSRLARGDVAAEVNKLKAEPGGPIEIGGAGLASTVMQLGLVDEYQIFVQPVILGDGIRLFPALDRSTNLRLADTRTFDSGTVYLHYQRVDGGSDV